MRRPKKIDWRMAKAQHVPSVFVAETLGVHLTTLYRQAQEGMLEATRVGKHWFFSIKAVCDYYKIPGLDEELQVWCDETVAEYEAELEAKKAAEEEEDED